MNIVHIVSSAPYNEGWGYQDNLLPKYHAKLGNNVTVITTNLEHVNQTIAEVEESDYFSTDGFRVIRKRIKTSPFKIIDVYQHLLDIKPDYVFFHGLVSFTILQVVKYKKKVNPSLIVVQDNHLDYNIGYKPKENVKDRMRCFIYKCMYKFSSKYIDKVYGVTPWRKQYAQEVFGVPENKTDLLIMGADDEYLDFKNRDSIRKKVRSELEIGKDEFVILTGGKIDKKKSVIELMEACKKINTIKLVVFGSVDEMLEEKFFDIVSDATNISYIGWIPSKSFYNYCFASDLVCFPGQHSVLWEQACASKTPCIFSRWPGMEHIDIGGNCLFFEKTDTQSIYNVIIQAIGNENYEKLKEVSRSSTMDGFLYSRIAEKSINDLVAKKKCDAI